MLDLVVSQAAVQDGLADGRGPTFNAAIN